MANKMLIDAAHPEETRVVVLRGNRVEEFDFESANRRQLRGNIYLAKVTRVEPSLQAAFIDYGGNRHGFLAFSEIHPDYYQIPVADRQALIAEDERAHRAAEAEHENRAGRAATTPPWAFRGTDNRSHPKRCGRRNAPSRIRTKCCSLKPRPMRLRLKRRRSITRPKARNRPRFMAMPIRRSCVTMSTRVPVRTTTPVTLISIPRHQTARPICRCRSSAMPNLSSNADDQASGR